jgi:glycosyltransferase involved in cell wall biosynthesis
MLPLRGKNPTDPGWLSGPLEDPLLAASAAEFEKQYGRGPGAPLVVVIAALDEAESIGAVLQSIPTELNGRPVDRLVVDDGSLDGTSAVASGFGALVCRLSENRGQGSALRLGYRLAALRGAQVIATMDADGQFDPTELPAVVGPVIAGQADFVNGSRRLGQAEKADRVRAVGVAVFGWIVSLLAGTRITDPSNGFRAFRVEVVDRVPQRQAQYQTAELLIGAAALGFRIHEVPVTVRARRAGASKKGSNLRYGYRFARVVLRTWWSLKIHPRLSQRIQGRRHRP